MKASGLMIEVVEDYDEMSRVAARFIARRLRERPSLVLGLATGETPIGTYRYLAQIARAEGISFSRVRTFNLDEYYGLGPSHPQSFRRFMEEHLFSRVDLTSAGIHFLDGLAPDPGAECRRYEEAIARAGGIDLQLLGIGRNGHIGFNEPGASLDSRTRLVRLSGETRAANSRFFPDPGGVPRLALTMGVATILEAREVILLATGPEKAEAVARAVLGPVSRDLPASALKLHPRTHFILDRPAAAGLPGIRLKRA